MAPNDFSTGCRRLAIMSVQAYNPGMISDTSPDAERVQIELIRKASVAQRWARMASLTAFTVNMSKRAIAKANPKLNQAELELKFVELSYGKQFADKLRSRPIGG
jgi:hypothetical protein